MSKLLIERDLYGLQFDNPSTYKDKVVAIGLPASPGAAVGQIVFNAEDAEEWNAEGKSAILVLHTSLSAECQALIPLFCGNKI